MALGLTELWAGLVAGAPSLVVAVGGVVIDEVPAGVKDVAIALFGVRDKIALVVGTLVLAGVFGAVLGLLAARGLWKGAAGFAGFAVLGTLAATRDPQASAVLAAIGAAVAAAVALALLHRMLARAPGAGAHEPDPDHEPATAEPMQPRGDRRVFLQLAGGATAFAVLSSGAGRLLTSRNAATVARARVDLPPPAVALGTPPAGTALEVDGLSPLFTPNDSFYRIDTALTIPRVDPATWRLQVTGMVDRPLTLSFDDLLAMPHEEVDVTLLCVSNEVGGHLAGNARWSGVRLTDLLDRAGVQVGATQIVGRSADGWTSGFPTEAAFDGRDALVAVGMNGEPLPLRHGFPARLVVAGLYGYVSATKWLTAIELTTLNGFDAYWVPRGWSKEGPVKTQSRIDVPAHRDSVAAGRVAVAGVAWAGIRGVSRVEVAVDDGDWQPARLAEELGSATWRQWLWEWDARPGRHTLTVRATDGEGTVQTSAPSRPAPDGATGHHRVTVEVG
ncbi:MAG: molybdopterin-dependent oxidoreductase [Egibacteraceae bacterium]